VVATAVTVAIIVVLVVLAWEEVHPIVVHAGLERLLVG
jgi:hypothetical protein